MPSKLKSLMIVALASTLLAVTGCANKKEPAEKAVAAAEASLAEFRADAEKYAADQLKQVDESIANLKAGLEKKDYSAVVVTAPAVNDAINNLKVTVAQQKTHAEEAMAAAQAEWTELSASVPQMVDAIQSRVDTLSKSRKLPKDLDQATWDSAKSGFENMKASWTQASTNFAEGKAGEAVRKAREAKAKGEEILQQLKMKTA